MSRVVHIDLPRNERYDDRDLSYAMDRSMMLHERSENPVSRSSRRHRASYAPESDGYLETHIRPHLTTCHSCGSTLETHANHIHLTASNDPMVLQEMARKNNQVVQRLNSKLPSESIFGQIHLKQLPNGRYPLLPSHMTLDQFRALSEQDIDSLLSDYNLNERHPGRPSRNYHDPSSIRQKKLSRLFEFLGAKNLVAYDNIRCGANEQYVTW